MQNDGTLSETHGNQTFVYKPGAPAVVCSTYGYQKVCR